MLVTLQTAQAIIAGFLGLLIGSFLNVVIYRLPKMMERQWSAECAAETGSTQTLAEPFNLMVPRSSCPHCGKQIRWFENIPVVSYFFLAGKCSACKTSISIRYPAIEILTSVMFILTAQHYGVGLISVAWAAFASILIAQFFIDFDTQLLPDDLNYPLLWLGLALSATGLGIPLTSSVWGAIAGYLSLWLVYHAYRLLTGKEGMGYGDFKLLAALGAWFGADHLIGIILLSSVVGAFIGGALIFVGKLAHKDIPIAFGPFLAGAGLISLALGPGRLEAMVPFAFPLSQISH